MKVFQDLVDLVLGLSSPAWRTAGTQRPVPMRPAADMREMAGLRGGGAVSFFRMDRIMVFVLRACGVAAGTPAGEAFCLARQVVEG